MAKYSNEFKRMVVEERLIHNKTYPTIEREHGVLRGTLYPWIQRYRKGELFLDKRTKRDQKAVEITEYEWSDNVLYPRNNDKRISISMNGLWDFQFVESDYCPKEKLDNPLLMGVPSSCIYVKKVDTPSKDLFLLIMNFMRSQIINGSTGPISIIEPFNVLEYYSYNSSTIVCNWCKILSSNNGLTISQFVA